MVKSAKGLLLATLEIDRSSRLPIYRQIEDFLRQMILTGKVLPNQKLPSTRELAADLGVSRITIKSVYEQLISEGYIRARTGAGTFVSEDLDAETPILPALDSSDKVIGSNRLSSAAVRIGQSQASIRYGSIMPFRPGVPALDKFPLKRWKRCFTHTMIERNQSHLSYGDPIGLKELRTSIASHLIDSRAMHVEPSQIIITSGAQQAFVLVCYVLLNSSDTVWYENPGHIAGREVMKIVGADVKPVPIDKEGLNLDYAIQKYPTPKVIFTTPSHQQPLGITMSISRRLGLIKYASANNLWIIEDDYDSEFRYRGRPLPALSALDKSGRVLYVGTFSKSMFSAIRLGYIVVPQWLVDPFAKARNIIGQNSSPITELALSRFMEEGSFSEHIRKMRRIYRDRKDTLLDALENYCADTLSPQKTDAGMHIIADLKAGLDDLIVHQKLLNSGIDSLPLSIYYEGKSNENALVLGFSAVPKKTITELVCKMSKILRNIK